MKVVKRILPMLLAGGMVLIMSACGGSHVADNAEEPDILPPPLGEMNAAQAKDAMALNALFYPVLTPLQSCLSDLPSCIGLNFPRTVDPAMAAAAEDQSSSAPMTPGKHDCTAGDPTQGSYTVTEDANTLNVTFDTDQNGCYDISNGQDIEGALMNACIGKIFSLENTSVNAAGVLNTYKVQYKGQVICTKDVGVDFNGYTTYASGNTDPNKANRHTYNMSVKKVDGLSIDGTYRNEQWNPGDEPQEDKKINDEIWTFSNLVLFLNKDNTLVSVGANGGADYDGKVRRGDTVHPSLALSINFDALTYRVEGNPDADVEISGSVKASCQPEYATYMTIEKLNDVDRIRDMNASRMPSEGRMEISLPGYNPATAVFSAPGTAQVAITSNDETVVYQSWRSITTTSSCSVLQKIIDRIIPPQKPIDSIEIQTGCSDQETTIIDESNPLVLERGEEKCINAWANYRDGSKGRVTTTVFWKSSDRSIATMDLLQRTSRVKGRRVGATTVTATLSGVTGSAPVQVITPAE